MENFWTIILAAGKGTRMGSEINKVALPIGGEPIIQKTIKILKDAGLSKIVVLVGYAKESVTKHLVSDIVVVEQKEQLGTAHAVQTAMQGIPSDAKDILVLYGDNSFLLDDETISKLYELHQSSSAKITILSSEAVDPTGHGRLIRNQNNEVSGIIEQKDASEDQLLIKEINLGVYIFDKLFLNEYLPKVGKSKATGEYYLTDLVKLAVAANLKVVALKLKDIKWRGINTKEELAEAEELLQKI